MCIYIYVLFGGLSIEAMIAVYMQRTDTVWSRKKVAGKHREAFQRSPVLPSADECYWVLMSAIECWGVLLSADNCY